MNTPFRYSACNYSPIITINIIAGTASQSDGKETPCI